MTSSALLKPLRGSDPPPSAEDLMVDLDPLHDITGDDAAVAEEIVHDLAESAAGLLDRAEEALASGDVRSVMRCAHTLKGSTGIIGATSLHRCVASLESLAAERDLERARSTVTDARRLLSATIAILRAEIERMREA